MSWLFSSILLITFACIDALLISTPYLTRRTMSFGVSVTEEMFLGKTLTTMRRQFVQINVLLQGILWLTLALLLFTGKEAVQQLSVTIYTLMTVVLFVLIQFIFYSKTKKFKATQPATTLAKYTIVIDTSFHRRKLVHSNLWFLIHLGVILTCFLLALNYYDLAPNRLIMHYNWQGNADRVGNKTYMRIFLPNVIQIVMLLIFWSTNVIIQKSKQQTQAGGNTEESIQHQVLFRRKWSMFTILMGFVMILLFSLMQLSMFRRIEPTTLAIISLGMPLCILISIFFLSLHTGQGGIRLRKGTMVNPSAHPAHDDTYWKLGGIYVNPNDPSLFVEKRMGIGWTLNFGRPMGFVILLGPIIISVIISIIAAW
ncbi:putative membrane protein [Paenibacillus shirakamiensis]|uniref:Membrane protein n=1 Tax=Paenibacillus shirakamiensis TaxID=1265935 RepID=A0ABS4JJ42_9BACL|nr:DUF5808 domain-containing protein [Paenibacillus shirakamiensis]MBP2001708.1 putative membrane protein [Paenibacillus shirakamiensis]